MSSIEGKKARKYDKKVNFRSKSKVFNKFILDNIKKNKPVKVCDLGCGPGNLIEILKNKVEEIYGVDVSKEMIKICREKFSKDKSVKIKRTSATKTGLKSNYFDYAVIRMSLHHIKDKRAVMDEAHRILKPKGRFIVIDKYYTGWLKFHLMVLFELIFKRKQWEYVVSKKESDEVLSRGFKTIKKKIISKDWFTKHVYMQVLEKI